ncbi:MAG: hypothetical protein R2778_06970 [Saprospiraceae bacterium]
MLKFAASNEAEVKTHALSNLTIAMMTGNAVRALTCLDRLLPITTRRLNPLILPTCLKLRIGVPDFIMSWRKEQAEIHFQNAWEIGQKEMTYTI